MEFQIILYVCKLHFKVPYQRMLLNGEFPTLQKQLRDWLAETLRFFLVIGEA